MTCSLCGTRKARRSCPAVRRMICPTCCGTKRLKEIACPADCPYLGNAEAHPPAVVQRQRKRDLPMLVQMIEGLTAPQGEALSLLQARIRMHRTTAIPPLHDSDVAEAMKALAATLETAARGILYEHQAASIPAMRLQQDLRAILAELAEHEQGRALGPAVLAPVLRRIETMVERAGRHFAPAPPAASGTSGAETVFLDFLERIGRPLEPHADGPDGDIQEPPQSRIILP